MTVSPRLALAAVATVAVISGIGAAVIMAPHAWALDIDRYLRAARDLQAGQFGIDRGYLYSPMAALLTLPLLAVPAVVATWGWLVAKVAVLLWMVRTQARGLGRVEMALVAVAALAFVPTIYDLLLGNVTVFVVLAVGLVAWRRDDWWSGVALGLLLATAPKPQLIPVLIWMLAYRRRALVGAGVTAATATVITAFLVGSATYAAWIDVLQAPDYLTGSMAGNQTVDALLPAIALPVKIATVALFAVSLWRGSSSGLIAALCTGLLIAPYTLAYSAMVLLLCVRPMVAAAPRVAMVLALIGPFAVIVSLPLYALAWLVVAAAIRPPAPEETAVTPPSLEPSPA
jgi:hypothetical protein